MQKRQYFRPTRKQKLFIEEFFKSEDTDFGKVSEKVGVSYEQVCRWFEYPPFMKWARKKLKSIIAKGSLEVWRAILFRAKRGDIQATKLILKLLEETDGNNHQNSAYEELLKVCKANGETFNPKTQHEEK